MLPKFQRLTTRQFEEVMKKGRVAHSSLFLFRVTPNQKDTKISAVAPVKIAKKAFLRNQIRRNIYNALEPLIEKVLPGIWTAIFAKSDISEMSIDQIRQDIDTFLSKNKMYK